MFCCGHKRTCVHVFTIIIAITMTLRRPASFLRHYVAPILRECDAWQSSGATTIRAGTLDVFAASKVKLGSGPDARRPTHGHSFQLGVKPHAFDAVDMVIAEQRTFPTAE